MVEKQKTEDKKDTIGRRETLSLSRVRILFASMACSETLFLRAREILADDFLGERFVAMRFFLQTLYEYYDEFTCLPEMDVLRSVVQAELLEASATADEETEVAEIFAVAKKLSKHPADFIAKKANDYLDVFAEMVLRDTLTDHLEHGDLKTVLRLHTNKVNSIRATNADRFANPFNEVGETGQTGRFIPTRIGFVDRYCGGTGPLSGNVIGHAATRSGGKTTLASQIACSVAAAAREESLITGKSPKMVYVLNYEEVHDPMVQTLSNWANIERNAMDVVIGTGDNKELSRNYKYKPYEQSMFRSQINKAAKHFKESGTREFYPSTEYERLQRAKSDLAQNLFIADFTPGSGRFGDLASGWVDGVVEFLTQHQLQIGNPGIDAVIIDYAGAMARAHMRTIRTTDGTARTLIEDLPLRMKHEVARPLDCFVWVSHQMAASEASRRPGSRPDPNKFKDCGSFAENCDYCIVNGIPVPDTGMAVFVHSKSRRGKRMPDCIASLNGEFARWEETNADYMVMGGKIVSRDEVDWQSKAGLGMGRE